MSMPETHLGLSSEQILDIQYDHEAPMGGDRKLVYTVFGLYIYHKRANQWVLVERQQKVEK